MLAARADVAAALADVHQIRVSLGLPPQPDGGDLGQVPPDLDQTFSSVLQAQADLIQSAAQLGVIHSFDETPKQMVEQFEKEGDINRTFARLATNAPDVKQAEAKLEAANRDLAQAELDLKYCDVIAEIDGVITRRNVNPGDNVQVGQSLMAIRSLSEIWVDANFKETQLGDLRIGQPVDLYVDMYGDRHVFKGRISGFTMGTGSTLALLPPQNATGNFVKVVQRLPVRIEVEDYDPDKYPLFIGASVVPYVYINKPATGPDAGKFLQAYCASIGEPRVRLATPAGRRDNDGRGTCALPASRAGEIPGWWPPSSSCRPSWRCSTPRSRSSRCAISPAACRRRSTTANGSSPATSPPTPSSCRSPAGCRRTSAAATTSCCRSPCSRSARDCAGWPPVSAS